MATNADPAVSGLRDQNRNHLLVNHLIQRSDSSVVNSRISPKLTGVVVLLSVVRQNGIWGTVWVTSNQPHRWTGYCRFESYHHTQPDTRVAP